MRFFNTAGPVKEGDHYVLEPLNRIGLDELLSLIEQKKYFVLHAPRQTGKTSMLLSLMARLNGEGRYKCIYINVESGQSAREDVRAAMKSILFELGDAASSMLGDESLLGEAETILEKAGPHSALRMSLTKLSENGDRPLVLLIDEIDALVGDTLISVLRQLRTGYAMRPARFPQSIVLCGVRDVRDYRIHGSSDKDPVTGGSAFNVKATSLRLGNFSRAETEALLHQHTDETGQVFRSEAVEAIWDASRGQPWLVNALAYEITYIMKENRDPSVVLTEEMVVRARENLILRRETHLDQLADKLREPRVHRVIAPILAGDQQSENLSDDDVAYVRDLGLIVDQPQLEIANPMYREVIPRMLTYPIQVSLSHETRRYVSSATGLLEIDKLLTAFQAFFREHSEHWTERFQYKEAGPQLLLQAFLQRVLNGGGRIEREYGLGRGRTDLHVIWYHADGVQRIVLELKILKGSREATVTAALPQITTYMDRCGTSEGHLVIFDRSDRKWEDKILRDEATHEGLTIRVWGM